jgi:predicted phage terminase large subunit-like protein
MKGSPVDLTIPVKPNNKKDESFRKSAAKKQAEQNLTCEGKPRKYARRVPIDTSIAPPMAEGRRGHGYKTTIDAPPDLPVDPGMPANRIRDPNLLASVTPAEDDHNPNESLITTEFAARQQEVAQYLLKLRDAQSSFLGFVKLMNPSWTNIPDFQHELIECLDLLEKDRLGVNNLLITMPPRHSKSATTTVNFPSYYMAKDPSRYTMSCSYNATLAIDFGRQVRTIVEDPKIHQAFPDFALNAKASAADVWRTHANGAYFAVGLNGTTSGRPANLLIVDDPIKAREDAESASSRNRVWDFYSSALSLRLQPDNHNNPPKQIIILTRWHPDDLAGRLMATADWKDGLWRHINFPAIRKVQTNKRLIRCELPKDNPDYVPLEQLGTLPKSDRYVKVYEDQALWPERFPLETLIRRRELNPREFASLYMQEPFIKGGNLIKTEWWQYYPDDLNPENFMSLIITVDTAFKTKEQNDPSVALVAGIDRFGDIYIIDVMRGKFEFHQLKQRLIRLNTFWRGKGLRAMYIEDKSSGQSILQELRRESGLSLIPYKVIGDKVAKINSVLPLIEGGRVFLPKASPWLDSFIEETVSFPGGTHDDQVDCLAMALEILSRTNVSPESWDSNLNASLSLNNQKSAYGASLNSITKKTGWKGWGL